ncbi:hypothetical protein BGX31_001726 [Mortierella sp. GBA43]|nr:hypothetical protein BGX31_001726 [Mortierella sp. GBA43]
MSLPRFLKTFHKKPDSRGLRSASDPNLSDASDSSSGPKDALGFPLPVTTVITVSPAPAHATATNESTPAVTTAQADPTPSVSTHPSSSSPSSRLTTMPKPIPSRSSTLPHSHIRDDPLLSTSCPQLPSPVSLASSPAPVPTPSPKAIHLSTFDNPNNTKRTTKSIGFEIGAPLLRSMDRDMAESAPEGVVGGANPLHAKPEPKAETSLQGSIGTSNGVQDQPVPEDDTSVGSVPAIVPTPRVRSRSGPFGSSLRPVSILKNKPKSILRWPSRPSQTDDQGMPSSTARLSVCSDTSKISRSSMYLQQDPISEGWIDVAMELGGAPPQLLPRRQSAQAEWGHLVQ